MFEAYCIGVDLGRLCDSTAIAVVERSARMGEFDAAFWAHRRITELRLRHLERIPVGTPYTDVARRVAEITHSKKLKGPCHLAVDATGVGAAVVDLLRSERPKATLMPVTITGGETERSGAEGYHVPKRDLIVGLQVMLQRGGLQIAGNLREGPAMVGELMAMEVKVTAAGNEQYGVWRRGQHDDLVLAVALGCWAAEKTYRPRRGKEEWWETEDMAWRMRGRDGGVRN